MVTIRLARHGSKKNPFYYITVADRTASRDGRFIERLGFYNPVAQGRSEMLRVDLERLEYWLGVGAQPTDVDVMGATPRQEIHDAQAQDHRRAADGRLTDPARHRRHGGRHAGQMRCPAGAGDEDAHHHQEFDDREAAQAALSSRSRHHGVPGSYE